MINNGKCIINVAFNVMFSPRIFERKEEVNNNFIQIQSMEVLSVSISRKYT